MAKFINKSEVQYKDGYLVDKEGNVVNPPANVIWEANNLEKAFQEALYLASQPEATPMPTLEGFKWRSQHEPNVAVFVSSTKHVDKRNAESRAILQELEMKSCAEDLIRQIDGKYHNLATWIGSDEYIVSDDCAVRFDCRRLGNPLDFDNQYLIWALAVADKDCVISRPLASAFLATDEKTFFPVGELFEDNVDDELGILGWDNEFFGGEEE